MNGSYREAFDLRVSACRKNFMCGLKYNKWKLWWWKLVISDTYNHVCRRDENEC